MEKFSLIAALLPIIIFLFWMIIGYAALSYLRTQRHLIQNALLSPTIGMVLTLLPTFWLSRLGLPVIKFGLLEILFLFTLAVLILLKNKPYFPLRYYLPFALTIFLALALTGYPLLLYGFNWISYGNDDMTNYCLSALRLLHHGYSETPSLNALKSHQDMSLYYWFLTIPSMSRAGADLLLALCSAVTQRLPIQIFMPLILALHLCLISAAGALICQSTRYRNVALACMIVLSFSALNTLGTIYQLIAQVAGMAILLTLAVFLLQPFDQLYRFHIFKQSVLISFIGMALLITYPEIAAILIFSSLLYFIILLTQGWRPGKRIILIMLFSIIICLLALNLYWVNIISFVNHQSHVSVLNSKNYIFPFFLYPNGLADLWGLQIMAMLPPEPWLSRSIIISCLLLCITMVGAIFQIYKRIPVAYIFSIICCFSLFFFIHHNGFTLFKLAIYIQPFLIGVLVILLYRLTPKYSIRILVIAFFCYFSWQSQKAYVSFSKGQLGQLYVEIVGASQKHMNNELQSLMHLLPERTEVIVGTPNIVLAKMIAINSIDKNLIFTSKNFFNFDDIYQIKKYHFMLSQAMPHLQKTAENLAGLSLKIPKEFFYLHNPNKPLQVAQFLAPTIHSSSKAKLLVISTDRTILNRSTLPSTDKNFLLLSWQKATNLILFISSTLGQEHYHGNNTDISLYNTEQDYFHPNHTLVGIGRYMLFTIVHPTPKIRLVLEITNTLKGKNAYSLPPAVIEGTQRTPLPLMGSGSARVFSPVIEPQQIQNMPYLMLDLARSVSPNLNYYKGVMSLYGDPIPLDNRYIVTYARNIALISNEDYQKMKIPVDVQLPQDLVNPNLEYSGIFEDGWVSKDAFLVLSSKQKHSKLLIKGTVILLQDKNFTTEMTVYMNDKKLVDKTLTVGDFAITIPVNSYTARDKIEMHFSKTQTFGSGDPRDIAIKLNYVGFTT